VHSSLAPNEPRIDYLQRESKTNILPLTLLSALVLMNVCPSRALAQDGNSHSTAPKQPVMTVDQQSDADTLLKVVRDATERFKDVSVAEAEGYALQFGCVTGDDSGAMGLHYVNGTLVNSGVLDATRSQIVI
jgi:hypothetical protein